ncbi:MAG: hypothetical protein SFY80_00905 [Verrucomicrobiota bacterium]|nr:hypothetical protein [Verrucomicrobiota bacterium]
MPFSVPATTRTLHTKQECLDLWATEGTRFRRLFKGMSPQQLGAKVRSGNCGHTYAQHIPCMLGWMEAARDYFKNRLEGRDVPFRDYESEPMLVYTNRLIDTLAPLPLPVIWNKLDIVEVEYRQIITDLPLDRFTKNSDGHGWDHFVWSTFGHYCEHNDEVEWQYSGRPGTVPDREYAFNGSK